MNNYDDHGAANADLRQQLREALRKAEQRELEALAQVDELQKVREEATAPLHKIIQQQNAERITINEENQRNYNQLREEATQPWKDACGLDNPADLEKLCDDRLDKLGVGLLAEALQPINERIEEATVAAAGAMQQRVAMIFDARSAYWAADMNKRKEEGDNKLASQSAEWEFEALSDAKEVRSLPLVTSDEGADWLRDRLQRAYAEGHRAALAADFDWMKFAAEQGWIEIAYKEKLQAREQAAYLRCANDMRGRSPLSNEQARTYEQWATEVKP